MSRHRLAGVSAAFAATALFLACGGDGGTPPNMSPTASITEPADGAIFGDGQAITFRGSASDDEDGSLIGARLVWASDRDGQLGTGTSVTSTLTVGAHTVTLTATDSDGATDADSIDVTVEVVQSTCGPPGGAGNVSLAVGEHTVFSGEPTYCLQFDATSASEAYLVGVQSTSESVTSLTPFRVTGDVAQTAATAQTAETAQSFTDLPGGRAGPRAQDVQALLSDGALRFRRHREVEARLRAWERENLRGARLAGTAASDLSGLVRRTSIPSNLSVGDTVDIRVTNVDTDTNLCTDFTTVEAVVRVNQGRSVWLEDVGNPPGGFDTSDLQALSDQFDQTIFQIDSTWFGAPTDVDGNGKVAILITKEVNRVPNLLGFVFSADLGNRSDCQASNEAEIYYGKAPDPNGTFGAPYSVNDARADAPFLLAHEFTHTIQFGRRIQNNALAFQSSWMAEGQATLAEEVNGWEFDGLGPRQNLGFDVAFRDTGIPWYENAFVDMALYFGFGGRNQVTNDPIKVTEAPHECSWLEVPSRGNDGPCIGSRQIYGVPWSMFRWINDQFGPSFPGGAQAIHRAFVDNDVSGFRNVEEVLGVDMEDILAEWAPMLFTDDRGISGLDSRLTFPSWNLLDIFEGLVPEARLEPIERSFTDFTLDLQVRGGSSAYLRLGGSSSGAGVGITGQSGGSLPAIIQVWVARLQ